jgi:hypothetical protein
MPGFSIPGCRRARGCAVPQIFASQHVFFHPTRSAKVIGSIIIGNVPLGAGG